MQAEPAQDTSSQLLLTGQSVRRPYTHLPRVTQTFFLWLWTHWVSLACPDKHLSYRCGQSMRHHTPRSLKSDMVPLKPDMVPLKSDMVPLESDMQPSSVHTEARPHDVHRPTHGRTASCRLRGKLARRVCTRGCQRQQHSPEHSAPLRHHHCHRTSSQTHRGAARSKDSDPRLHLRRGAAQGRPSRNSSSGRQRQPGPPS